MQKLMLAGNQLSDLPIELANCSQLELLRLSANQFAVLPAWLLTMPALAWLAIAGNSLTDSFEAARQALPIQAPSIAEIDWQDIELGAKLGEGASGVISKAKLQQADALSKDVAVKIFKSNVTSDGLPRCEMAASIAVGLHPNLVGVMGKIRHHPNGEQGLVMPLIASNYTNLAQPPSLESCTRDIYAQATAFSLQELISLALGIARAAEHLHACGILHGDLYAHNILHNAEGHGLLGDFGAASFLPMQDDYASHSLQRIEVRAFGILLGELISHCLESDDDANSPIFQATKSTLIELQKRCTQAEVSARPLFAEVVQSMNVLNLHMDLTWN
jgi:serine/threonine protein kinase